MELEPVARQNPFVIGQSYDQLFPDGGAVISGRNKVVVGGARDRDGNYAVGSRAGASSGSPRKLTVIGKTG